MYKVPSEILEESKRLIQELLNMAAPEPDEQKIVNEALDHIKLLELNYGV